MNPTDFIRKWSPGGTAHGLNERAGAQPHFIDLCRLLGVPEPADPEHYCFERGLVKTGSAAARSDGFADVWLRGHFAWEYKRPGRSLKGRQTEQVGEPGIGTGAPECVPTRATIEGAIRAAPPKGTRKRGVGRGGCASASGRPSPAGLRRSPLRRLRLRAV